MFVRVVQHSPQTIEKMTSKREPREFIAETSVNSFNSPVQFEVVKSMETTHGHKYILDGRIEAPGGKTAQVRTVWIVDRGLARPRLVTAYPQ